MAIETLTLNQGSGGDDLAVDVIDSKVHQLVKIEFGVDGSQTMVSASDPLPVDLGSNNDVTVTGSVTANAGTNLNTSALALDATLAAQSAKLPATLGQKAKAASLAVTLASDEDALAVTGPLTDAELRAVPVPVSGTVTANLGTIAGVATETTLAAQSAKLPATIGQKAKAASLAVTLASDEDTVTVDGTVTANLGTIAGVATEATLADVKTAVEVLDDWDETNRAAVNLISGQAGVTGGAGNTDAATQRVVIASNQAAVTVDGSGVTQPVSGTVTANLGTIGAAATEASLADVKTAVELVDDIVETDGLGTVAQGAVVLGKDGTTPRAVHVTATGQVEVVSNGANVATETTAGAIKTAVEKIDDMISGSEAQVDIVTNTDSVDGPGAPSIDSYADDPIDLAASTADQSLVAAPGANKQIWVYGIALSAGADTTIALQDEDNTAVTGTMELKDGGGYVMPPSGNFAMPWFKVATNKALEADTGAGTIDGIISYAIVSV